MIQINQLLKITANINSKSKKHYVNMLLPSHGNYAVIAGERAEATIVRNLVKDFNQPVVVYGTPPKYLEKPYSVVLSAAWPGTACLSAACLSAAWTEESVLPTAEIQLNTTIISYGIRLPPSVIKNPMVGSIYVAEYPWVLRNPEQFYQIFVCPRDLPLERRGQVYSEIFVKSITYDKFVRYLNDFPRGILKVSDCGVVKEVKVK